MVQCDLRNPRDTVLSWEVVTVFLLIIFDLSLTMSGTTTGQGVEGNPFFKPFVENHLAAFGAITFYFALLVLLYSIMPRWLRAMTTGLLIASHTFGTLSWARLLIASELDIFFNMFYLLVGSALIASMFTIISYVDVNSCPSTRWEEEKPRLKWE